MGVTDGQRGNQTTLNNAFMARNNDTSTTGAVNLASAASADGTAVTSSQKEHNSIASFVGKSLNTAKDALPSWASDIVGSASQTVKARIESIVSKFRDTAANGGHTHAGTDGQGAKIPVASISATGSPSSLNYLRGDGAWAVAGGSGQGGVNYLILDATMQAASTSSSDFETDAGNWAAYADAAAATPVNMIGGSPTVTFTRVTTGTVLNGTAHGVITKDAANRQGEGVSCLANIPPAYRKSRQYFSFPYRVLSGTYALDDLKVFAYDWDNLEVVTPFVQSTMIGGTSNTTGICYGYFDLKSNCTQISFGLHVASTSAVAFTMGIDDVKVGPSAMSFTAPVSDETAVSGMTYDGLGTTTLESVWARRVGDNWHIRGYLKTGTTAATSAAIVLPSGKTLDTSKLSSTTNAHILGRFGRIETGVSGTAMGGVLFYDGSTTNKLFLTFGSASNQLTKTNGNSLFSTNDGMSFQAIIPISGWSSNVQMADSAIVYAYNSATADSDDTSSFVSGAEGVAIGSYTTATRTKRIRFGRSVGSSDHVFLELQVNGQWIKAAEYILGYTRQGTNDYGIQVVPVASSTTDYDVKFSIGGARPNNATYAGAGEAWSTYTGVKWRLVAGSNAVSVGAESVRSELYFDDYVGYGGTNTKIPYFNTVQKNTGTAFSYTNDSSTGGGGLLITILEDGLYESDFAMDSATSQQVAIAVDCSAKTAAASGLTYAQGRRSYAECSPTPSTHWGGFLRAGQVVNPQTDGTAATAAATRQFFCIRKVNL